ncbi:glutamate racemase [Acinetobacter guillouiae]|uniref:glutamate racemase n=1 Tax=Acinetobacter guillouiae TaxID=106649 RepID=UPI002FD8F717
MKSNVFYNDDNIFFYNSAGMSISHHESSTPKILVFDSGVGGLSISKHLEAKFHNADIIYIADSEFFPYGNKDVLVLKDRVTKLIKQAIKVFKTIGFIVACNTASTLVSDDFINNLHIPCMRILPPIKEAFSLSKCKNVLLIATPNTIESQYVKNESNELNGSDYIFHKVGVAELVKFAEKKSRNEVVTVDDIHKLLLKDLSQAEIEKIDVVILGCTHFPSLQLELKNILSNVTHWVDPAFKIVNQLHENLYGKLSNPNKGKFVFCTSIMDDEHFHSAYSYINVPPILVRTIPAIPVPNVPLQLSTVNLFHKSKNVLLFFHPRKF